MFANILPKVTNLLQYQLTNVLFKSNFHSITSSVIAPSVANPGGAWSTISSRTIIRNNFPRAREGKRIKTHGWLKRMSTPEGRRILMRRILKGRHALSH